MDGFMCKQVPLKHLLPWISQCHSRYIWKYLCCGYVPQWVHVWRACGPKDKSILQQKVHIPRISPYWSRRSHITKHLWLWRSLHDVASSPWSTSGCAWGHAGAPQSVWPWISPRYTGNTCRGIPAMGMDALEQDHSLRDCGLSPCRSRCVSEGAVAHEQGHTGTWTSQWNGGCGRVYTTAGIALKWLAHICFHMEPVHCTINPIQSRSKGRSSL